MRVWIAIWVGSTHISRIIGAWIAGGALLRISVLLLAAGFIKGLPVTTGIAWLLAAGWIATAVILGLRAPAPATAPDAPDDTPQQPALPTRDELATALHKTGAPHAHLKALAEALGTTTDRTREALTQAGIPIEGGVRMKGRKVAVSTGVKADHFPPLPSPSPDGDVAVVAAGQSNNNNADGVGERFVQDEKNPHRWRVLRRA